MTVSAGDKLQAAIFNAAFVSRTEDTSTTGRFQTDKWITHGKSSVAGAASLNLTVDAGVLEVTGAAATDIAGFTASAPGLEDGQQAVVVNGTTQPMSFSVFAGKDIEVQPGCSLPIYYCNGAFRPINAGGSMGAVECAVTQAGHGFTALQAVRVDTTGTWVLGDASNAAVNPSTHVVKEVVDGNNFVVQSVGVIEVAGHGLNVGEFYFDDPTAPGGVTATQNTNVGEWDNSVLYVLSATKLEVTAGDRPVLITAGGGTAPVFIDTFTGNANEPVETNADGFIDNSLIEDDRYVFRTLSANMQFPTIGNRPEVIDLRVTGLTVGTSYQVDLVANLDNIAAAGNANFVAVDVVNGTAPTAPGFITSTDRQSSGTTIRWAATISASRKFVAVDTELRFYLFSSAATAASIFLIGNGSNSQTQVTVTELNNATREATGNF